jgi:hypothetical protein
LFHSEKLMEIRQFAASRKQLILQIYTYLRDAQAKDFYHESMAGEFGNGSEAFKWQLRLKSPLEMDPSQNAAGAPAKIYTSSSILWASVTSALSRPCPIKARLRKLPNPLSIKSELIQLKIYKNCLRAH